MVDASSVIATDFFISAYWSRAFLIRKTGGSDLPDTCAVQRPVSAFENVILAISVFWSSTLSKTAKRMISGGLLEGAVRGRSKIIRSSCHGRYQSSGFISSALSHKQNARNKLQLGLLVKGFEAIRCQADLPYVPKASPWEQSYRDSKKSQRPPSVSRSFGKDLFWHRRKCRDVACMRPILLPRVDGSQ